MTNNGHSTVTRDDVLNRVAQLEEIPVDQLHDETPISISTVALCFVTFGGGGLVVYGATIALKGLLKGLVGRHKHASTK